MQALGTISSILLVLCSIPGASGSMQAAHVPAIRAFTVLWWGGEVLGLIYTVHNKDWPLVLNYGFNTVATSIAMYYIFIGRYLNARKESESSKTDV